MLMRILAAAAAALLLAPAALRAEELGPAESAAIRQVIESQLDAFQRDDAGAAFSYATPDIQAKFQTPDIFMSMVRQGYQPVYRPRAFEFRELSLDGSMIFQDVYIVGPDGQPVIARYEMERQPDGSWRINGCYLIKAPDLAV